MPQEKYEVRPGTNGIAPERLLTTWYHYATKTHFWIQWRNRAILNIASSNGMSPSKPMRILDIGSGRGVVTECLEPLTEWTIDGVDIDRDALQASVRGRGRLLYYNITKRDPEFREAYDGVLMLDVLEHIKDCGEFLAAALFHLKPGGILIISAPALMWLFSSYDRAAGHLRRYNRRALLEEFKGLDADPADVRYWGMGLVPIVLLRGLFLSRQMDVDDILRRGFAPTIPLINVLMTLLMRLETGLFRKPLIGAAIVLCARKTSPMTAESQIIPKTR